MLQVLELPIKSGFTIEICAFLFSVRASQLTHVKEKKSFQIHMFGSKNTAQQDSVYA